MAEFTANKLKETRGRAGLSQAEAAKKLQFSERKLRMIEANETSVTSDEIVEFAKLYKVDVRELLLESYGDVETEQTLCNRYYSLIKLYDQLNDVEKEDIYWVIKQRVEGKI